jgi:hypothetical protein
LFGLTQIFAPHPLAPICLQLLGEMRVGGLVGGMFFACMVLRGYPSAYAIRDFLPRSDIRV